MTAGATPSGGVPSNLGLEQVTPPLQAEVHPADEGRIKIGDKTYRVTVESQGKPITLTEGELKQLTKMAVDIINKSGIKLGEYSPTKITTSDHGPTELHAIRTATDEHVIKRLTGDEMKTEVGKINDFVTKMFTKRAEKQKEEKAEKKRRARRRRRRPRGEEKLVARRGRTTDQQQQQQQRVDQQQQQQQRVDQQQQQQRVDPQQQQRVDPQQQQQQPVDQTGKKSQEEELDELLHDLGGEVPRPAEEDEKS